MEDFEEVVRREVHALTRALAGSHDSVTGKVQTLIMRFSELLSHPVWKQLAALDYNKDWICLKEWEATLSEKTIKSRFQKYTGWVFALVHRSINRYEFFFDGFQLPDNWISTDHDAEVLLPVVPEISQILAIDDYDETPLPFPVEMADRCFYPAYAYLLLTTFFSDDSRLVAISRDRKEILINNFDAEYIEVGAIEAGEFVRHRYGY